jgi:hypothetical protein
MEKERKENREKAILLGASRQQIAAAVLRNSFTQIVTALDHCADETVIDVRVNPGKRTADIEMSRSSLPANGEPC